MQGIINNEIIYEERYWEVLVMRISEKLGLSMSPYEMDFLDVDIEKDSELYIDPFLIANSNSQWAIQTDLVIKSFFNGTK